MNPLQTLQDLYNQIAEIKEYICQTPQQEKDKILSLPRFNLTGLAGEVTLERENLFAEKIQTALQDLFFFHSIRDTHGKFTKLANEIIIAYNNFLEIELPRTSIHLILISLLEQITSIPTSFEDWNFLDMGEAYGSREIDLPKEVEYIGIEIVEYPEWVVRQFYYIPFVEEIGISSSLKGFFFNSTFGGFLDYAIQIPSTKTVLRKPEEATKFYLYALPQMKSLIKLWRRYAYE